MSAEDKTTNPARSLIDKIVQIDKPDHPRDGQTGIAVYAYATGEITVHFPDGEQSKFDTWDLAEV